MLKNVAKSAFTVKCTKDTFFRRWMEVTSPYHHLTGKESELAAAFLKERFLLSKSILDEALLDRILMTSEIQEKIRTSIEGDTEMSSSHFLVLRGKLRAKGFFDDKWRITPLLIPKISNEDTQFLAITVFNIDS